MKAIHASALAVLVLCFSIFSSASAQTQGTWSPAPSSGFTPRAGLTSNVIGGKIYVIGGMGASNFAFTNVTEIFDPATQTWSSTMTPSALVGRTGHTSCEVNGKIYVMGGFNHISEHVGMDTMQVFDPATETWSGVTKSGTYENGAGFAGAVVGGKIYLIGGWNGTEILDTVQIFDPATSTWSIPSTTGTFTPREGLTCSVINNMIYAIGGNGLDGQPLASLEVFDPATNTWSTPVTTGTFTAREGCTSCVLGGKIYVIGGATGSGVALNTVDVFDPITNVWSTPTTTGTLTARSGLTSAVIGDKIYAMGGSDGIGASLNTNEVYTASPLGVKGEASSTSIMLSPNPTTGIVTIEGLPAGIRTAAITDLLGKQVLTIAGISTTSHSFDLSTLPSGTYIASFSDGKNVVTRMLVKD